MSGADERAAAGSAHASRTRLALQRPAAKAISPPWRRPANRQQPARSLTKSASGRADKPIEAWERRRASYLQQTGRSDELAIEQEDRYNRMSRASARERMACSREYEMRQT